MPHRRFVRATATAVGVVVAVSFLASATPPGKHRLSCQATDVPPCKAVTGRLVAVEERTGGATQLVLLGSSSVSRRLITSITMPRWARPAKLPGRGRWVSVVGHAVVEPDGSMKLVADRVAT